MKLAIAQPNFLPWLGWFEMLDAVDLLVSLDTVQVGRQSFQVRNRIRLDDGRAAWVTVALASAPLATTFREARLAERDFWTPMIRRISHAYRGAPAFSEYAGRLEDLLRPREDEQVLSRYSRRLIETLAGWLGIDTRIVDASELVPEPAAGPQDKVLELCRATGADTYLNAARGVDAGLYEAAAFEAEGIALLKQDYRHPTYTQHGGGFTSHLSVLDLLFEQGEASLGILRSGRSWVQVTGGAAKDPPR